MSLALKPKRGGFLRPFGCGEFIRDFLLGKGPYGSAEIDTEVGAPQANIFMEYKLALMRATASERALKLEEKRARKEHRDFRPENFEELEKLIFAELPYKNFSCRAHSFNTYFSNLKKLGWVEFTGRQEPSAFQDHYSQGQPRKYYRLTRAGKEANPDAWRNPHRALYG